MTDNMIFEQLHIDKEHLVGMRRHLHRHPELSGYEENTLRFIAAELDSLGIPYTEVEKGGIIARIGESGPRVLLRADMDALPVEEDACNLQQAKAVCSEVPGVAHACGHDAHTAMLLTAAKALQEKQQKGELPAGTVILCFERAEETGGPDLTYGYGRLFHYMDENGLSPDACYALHVEPGLTAGHISAEPGGVYAGGFGFGIRIHGKGGHGSRPDQARNPLDAFTSFYQTMQGVPLHSFDPFRVVTFSIPVVHMGEAGNVIPDELRFEGTARGMDKDTLAAFRERFFEALECACSLYGCSMEVQYQWMTDPVVNRREDALRLRRTVEQNFGAEFYEPVQATLNSETFAHYTDHYGGAIAFLGVRNDALGSGSPLHSPQFDLDEEALPYGAALLALTAMDALHALNTSDAPEA